MAVRPTKAMVLAGGLGVRMRPLTLTTPKPLVPLAGKPLLDHVLDRLEAAGIETVVINVHYLPEQIEAHAKSRAHPRIVISDERAVLLDTGGGVLKALDSLGPDPFFICNADSLSLPASTPSLARMAATFEPEAMDCMMLLAPAASALGYDGPGDFFMTPDGVLKRRGEREIAPFVFTGTSLAHPGLFRDAPAGPFSLNRLWDRAMESGRLRGMRQDGQWLHVGTPEALAQAEHLLANGELYF
jgi:N-acetyl-alpha-D-muramate 1-phosphate uridylyltransferase